MTGASPGAARAEAKSETDAAAAAVTLPPNSPFFKDETGSQAGERLRALFNRDDKQFIEALLVVRNRAPKVRADLCAGAALLSPGGRPTLGGWNLERVVPCDSLAKLYVLYAFYQLHADVAFLGATIDVSTAKTNIARVKAFQTAIAAAFARAKDTELQNIGETPSVMPRLTRLFDLKAFVDQPQSRRSQDTLTFDIEQLGQANASTDNWKTSDRLDQMMQVSNNDAATSLMADIGLPYIAAWLRRSGFAYLAEGENGLWLSKAYGQWPVRKTPDDPPPVSKPVNPTRATGGMSKGASLGQAGSVLGHVTALCLLQRGELVNRWASDKMIATMAKGAMLADSIKKDGRIIFERNKVGISTTWTRYAEAVLLKTQARPAIADAGTPELTWCTAILDFNTPPKGNSDKTHDAATSVFADLGIEIDVEITKLATRLVKK